MFIYNVQTGEFRPNNILGVSWLWFDNYHYLCTYMDVYIYIPCRCGGDYTYYIAINDFRNVQYV